MPTYPIVTSAIKTFLEHTKNENNADLVERYNRAMEAQVNVHPGDDGESSEAKNTFTNGTLEWFNFRIPKKAMTEPEHNDWRIKWPLELYADGIGMTGWDWEHKLSIWAAYDFDSITEHAQGVGIGKNDLLEVQERAAQIPWVQVRKSTGGGGLHLYVFFNPHDLPHTVDHTEHAALARAVLGLMAGEAGFDFQSKLDVCGGNMWIWHRKLSLETEGLKIIKEPESVLTHLPLNWKDHIPVIKRKRTKVYMPGIEDKDETSFDKLSAALKRIPQDDTHKEFIHWCDTHGDYASSWSADHHCLHAHTVLIRDYIRDLRMKGDNIRGFFETNSLGSDPNKPNCFMFPMSDGAWKVVRFGRGTSEASTWQNDKENWTWCYFNRAPDLQMASTAFGGKETEKRGYEFESITEAEQVIQHLGATNGLSLPDGFKEREDITLRAHKDGRLVATMPMNDKEDDKDLMRKHGWVKERGKKWQQIFNVQTRIKDTLDMSAPELTDLDNEIRATIDTAGREAGWYVFNAQSIWSLQPKDNIKDILISMGRTSNEAKAITGDCVKRAWTKVNIPFGVEFPGNRQWNKDSAQFRYQSTNLEPSEIKHPHWDLVMAHCGRDLDNLLKNSSWGRQYSIKSGREYLTRWISCMFRAPYEHLPYLFFFGNQSCGKSIFREAIELLCTRGCIQADNSLINTGGFNGELHEAVLCYVEETDLSKSGTLAYNRIKEYVTNDTLSVHIKRMQPFMAPNTTHWCQMANTRESLPIFKGDTRVIVIHVSDLVQEIPKRVLLAKLQEEAPQFMQTLMQLELPPSTGRLRLPILTTSSKEASEEANQDAMQAFLDSSCYYVLGERVTFKEFHDRLQDSLHPWERGQWHRRKVSASLPPEFPVGAGGANKRFIGNMSFEDIEPKEDAKKLVVVNKYLVEEGDTRYDE